MDEFLSGRYLRPTWKYPAVHI